MADQTQKAIKVKRKNESQWLKMDEVVAVGVGVVDEEPGIIISVKTNPQVVRKQIPFTIEDVKIDIRKTGEIRAQK